MSALCEQRLDVELQKAEILQLRAKAMTVPEIAEKMGMTGKRVADILNQAATSCRNRHREEIDLLWALQAEKEEMIWRVIQPELDKKLFDRDVIMCAIKWLERQAKRTGLDISASRLSEEFLMQKSDAELLLLARQMGIIVTKEEVCGPEGSQTAQLAE